MRSKNHTDKIKNSGYIEYSDYNDYLEDLKLLTNQKMVDQESEFKILKKKIKNLIDIKFNGNKEDAIIFIQTYNGN